MTKLNDVNKHDLYQSSSTVGRLDCVYLSRTFGRLSWAVLTSIYQYDTLIINSAVRRPDNNIARRLGSSRKVDWRSDD